MPHIGRRVESAEFGPCPAEAGGREGRGAAETQLRPQEGFRLFSGRMEASCLELALEGERACKGGDFQAGAAFFEEAVRVGTEDLKTLSAIYSQLGNAYFYLKEYAKALEYHQHDLTLARWAPGVRLGVGCDAAAPASGAPCLVSARCKACWEQPRSVPRVLPRGRGRPGSHFRLGGGEAGGVCGARPPRTPPAAGSSPTRCTMGRLCSCSP